MSEDTNAAFELLKQDFPVFELLNRKNVSSEIALNNNDSVVAQPGATIRVNSVELIQLPNVLHFKFISPTMEDLVKYGLITRREPATKASEMPVHFGEQPPEASGSNKPVLDENQSPLVNSPVPNKPDTIDDSRPAAVSTTKKSSGGNK